MNKEKLPTCRTCGNVFDSFSSKHIYCDKACYMNRAKQETKEQALQEEVEKLTLALERIKAHQETLATGEIGGRQAYEFTVAWQIAKQALKEDK